MPRVGVALVWIAAAGATLGVPLLAQKPPAPAAAGERLNACTILSRDEVRKIAAWSPGSDQFKESEQPVGAGSVCVYPNVQVYVGPYSAARLDSERKRAPMVPVAGIGDEAFLQQNGKHWAVLYVKVGARAVFVEQEIPPAGTFESVKPSVLALGKALAAKLR